MSKEKLEDDEGFINWFCYDNEHEKCSSRTCMCKCHADDKTHWRIIENEYQMKNCKCKRPYRSIKHYCGKKEQ